MADSFAVDGATEVGRALRAVLRFESSFVSGTEGLGGMLATGALRIVDGPTGRPSDALDDLPPELRNEAAQWQGPRGDHAQVIVAGELARVLDERRDPARSASPFGRDAGGNPMVDVIVTGRPAETMFVNDPETNIVVFAYNTAIRHRTLQDREERAQKLEADAAIGGAYAIQEVARYELLQRAATEQRSTNVELDGIAVPLPILTTAGRWLQAAGVFADEAAVWDQNPRQQRREPRDMALRRTARSFLDALGPSLLSATSNPRRFDDEMRALSRRHSDLFGAGEPSTPAARYVREHIEGFLAFPKDNAGELSAVLAHSRTVDPNHVVAFTDRVGALLQGNEARRRWDRGLG